MRSLRTISASSYNILPASTCDPWARPVPILARASPSSLRRAYHLTNNPGSTTPTVQMFPFRTPRVVTWLLIMELKLSAGLSGNSSRERANDTGAAVFHQRRGPCLHTLSAYRVGLSRRRGFEPNPRIPSSADSISGSCNWTDRLSPEPPCAYYSYLPKTRPHWSHSPCHCFVESGIFTHDFANKALQLSSAHTRPRPLFGSEHTLRPQPHLSTRVSQHCLAQGLPHKTLSVSRRVASTYSKVADFVSRESLGYNGLETVTCYPGRYQPVVFFPT